MNDANALVIAMVLGFLVILGVLHFTITPVTERIKWCKDNGGVAKYDRNNNYEGCEIK